MLINLVCSDSHSDTVSRETAVCQLGRAPTTKTEINRSLIGLGHKFSSQHDPWSFLSIIKKTFLQPGLYNKLLIKYYSYINYLAYHNNLCNIIA